ncbi:MAG: AAA family ATPase [Actinomycetota bacterium]|nr:AAA family ATPase [Actinomycetota bacterium]
MRPRLTSSHIVGRVAELAELELALHEAAAGHPVLVLLGGESGVGKTRLVAELEGRLAAPSNQASGEATPLVLRGAAVEQADGELPYAPLLSAFRPLVRERHPVLSKLSRGSRAEVAKLLPGLAEETTAPAAQPDPSSQLRLFEALLELLDLLSESTPTVVVLEDVHWADRSTRAFVAFLARSLREERVTLVLTYRTDEMHRRHALLPLLTELGRLERARRIQLSPFDRAELAEALGDILGDAPSEQLVDRLYSRSEGNPLYTEELLAAGLDGRGATPQSLQHAFMLRIERLSADAQRAIRPIAVGRALDEATIAQIICADHESLQMALREAVSQQVLCTGDEADQLCFRHALLREAVYDDLLPGERAELHLALATAYEGRAAGVDGIDVERIATIAHHYAAAGDQPNALRATVQAAQAARDVHAYGETADLAERALELWPRVAHPEQIANLDHVDLLELAATGESLEGDRARAEVLLQTALGEISPEADPRRYSSLLARVARMQWSLNRQGESVETAQQALTLLPADEATGERASLLAWFARTQTLRGHFRDAVRDGRDALEAAIAARDRRSETEVLNTLGMALVGLGEVEDGLSHLRAAIELARENDDVDSESVAYGNLADMLGGAGRTLEALATAKDGLDATPGRWSRYRHWLSVTVSVHAFNAGDWDTARAHLGPAPSAQLGTLLIFRQLHQSQLALGEGDEELAAESLERIEPLVAVSSEPQYIGAFGALLAELRRRQRELQAARAAVSNALDRVELCTDDVEQVASVSAVGVGVEADIAWRARDLREKADERDAIARARIHMQRLTAAAQDGGPLERAWRATGTAELARARGKQDPSTWLKASAAWESVERPYAAAIARWRAAEAQVAVGDRAAAAQSAAEALQTVRRLGSRWLIAELTGLAERARLDLDHGVASARPSTQEDGDDDPFGLTVRERQVLALIAEGATNRQIGAALYMAEKTASVHVSRILGKLGVRSRTEAAAVAHRQNLAHPRDLPAGTAMAGRASSAR